MGIEQTGEVILGWIHHARRFPVEQTACGAMGPATDEWPYVSCPACIAARWRPAATRPAAPPGSPDGGRPMK